MKSIFSSSSIRRALAVVTVCLASTLSAQTVFIPSGTSGIGSISGANVGIGTNTPGAKLDVQGNGRFSGGATFGYTGNIGANNGLILGTVAKTTAPSGGQGSIQIFSNDASTPLQGWMSLITDGAPGNRRLAFGVIEQGTAWRNITLAEMAGNVGIGTPSPTTTLDILKSTGDALQLKTAESNPARLVFGNTGSAWYLSATKTDSGTWMPLTIWTSDNERFRIDADGDVGIGVTNPTAKLDVGGLARAQSMAIWGSGQLQLQMQNLGDPSNQRFTELIQQNGQFVGRFVNDSYNAADAWLVVSRLSASYAAKSVVFPSGNVGIGIFDPTHKLTVNGTIRAKEVIVDNTGWPDYVFEHDYRLAPLSEVEAHIQEKKHLPGIPSASEIAEHGVSMGEMQGRLLAKIEELTLHQIEQEKRLRRQEDRLTAQDEKIQALASENAALRERLISTP